MERIIERAIILFACSGIDAVVKQLIIENLEQVIERDEGAQEQLRKYAKRNMRKGQDTNYELLVELFIAKTAERI